MSVTDDDDELPPWQGERYRDVLGAMRWNYRNESEKQDDQA